MKLKNRVIFTAGFFLLSSLIWCTYLIGEENQSSPRKSFPQRRLTKEKDERRALQKEMYELVRDGSDTAFAQLADYTNNDDPMLRRMATRALSRSKHKDTNDLLLFLIGDENKGVRGAAALSLGYQRGEGSYKALLDILEKDESSYVKGKAVYALGMFRTEESLAKVISSLKSNVQSVRINAAGALGKSENKKAIEPLISALRDPEDKVRVRAAKSLNILTGQEELYNKTRDVPVKEAYEAWQEWWQKNGNTFEVVKKSLAYSRSAKEWIKRLDTDKSGCLNEHELQAGLDSFFGAR